MACSKDVMAAYAREWRKNRAESNDPNIIEKELLRKKAASARTILWQKNNRERTNAKCKKYSDNNKEKELERGRVKRIVYKNKIQAQQKIYQSENLDKGAAKESRRRASKLQATPLWANLFFISEAYHLAKLRESICGGKWHVDHIVPLKSKIVCGLHVEHNLRVIPAVVNLKKHNSHSPNNVIYHGVVF